MATSLFKNRALKLTLILLLFSLNLPSLARVYSKPGATSEQTNGQYSNKSPRLIEEQLEFEKQGIEYSAQLKKWNASKPNSPLKENLDHSSSVKLAEYPANKDIYESNTQKAVEEKNEMRAIHTEKAQATINNQIYKLQPKYLLNNFDFEMMSSVVTLNNQNFYTTGDFRSNRSFDGMYWETDDTHSHPAMKYTSDPNFQNVILDYNYVISGNTARLDGLVSPTLIVKTNDGQQYYVRLWNYVVNRPLDDWEKGVREQAGTNYVFPTGRTPGGATGLSGTIEIDFNNLYAGWYPYQWERHVKTDPNGDPVLDENGDPQYIGVWVPDPDWVKVPVNNIKSLQWTFVPQDYTDEENEKHYYNESSMYRVDFNNWRVYGNINLGNEPAATPSKSVRICDDYDNEYDMTPERLVDEYINQGFGGVVNLYIGASHFYDKKYDGSQMSLIVEHPFNDAFNAWYQNYVERLAEKNINVIHSISMEIVDAPPSWWQRAWDNTPATTGYNPSPHLMSFTNKDVMKYYQSLVNSLAKFSDDSNMTPIVQLGEPWWWSLNNIAGTPPAFYDQSTRDLYQRQFGSPMHEFHSSFEDSSDYPELLNWLRDQNGLFSVNLRNSLKESFPNSKFTVLFFAPSILDEDVVTKMMKTVNYPIQYWAYPNLDMFMLEDYDYLTSNQMEKHRQAMDEVKNTLGYPSSLIDYLSGADDTNNDSIWKNIDQGINDGLNNGYKDVFLWAYPQVRTRKWNQPDLIQSNLPSGVYKDPVHVSLTSANSEKIIFTTDGSNPSLTNGSIYSSPIPITNDTKLKAIAVKNDSYHNIVEFDYYFDEVHYTYNLNNQLQAISYFKNNIWSRKFISYDRNGNKKNVIDEHIFDMWQDINIVPLMRADKSMDGIASASSNFGTDYAPYKAFDHQDSEQSWITNNTVTGWLEYRFQTSKHVVSYQIVPRNVASQLSASPKSWSFEGYNGSQWIVLSKESNITDWKVGVKKKFVVTAPGNYSAYRINVESNNGYSFTSIGELEMMEGRQDIDVDYNLVPAMSSENENGFIVSASSSFGADYSPSKAFDHQDSEQSWITNGTIGGWLEVHLAAPKEVLSYVIYPRRNQTDISASPKSWIMEGYDGNSWNTISSENNVSNWNVGVPKQFYIQHPDRYQAYRLKIMENNGFKFTSVGELELQAY